jgi:hypothetical protein
MLMSGINWQISSNTAGRPGRRLVSLPLIRSGYPGEYKISIRAVGYDIDAPTKATVQSEKTTTTDIRRAQGPSTTPQRDALLAPESQSFLGNIAVGLRDS